jgi:hypothetical protein
VEAGAAAVSAPLAIGLAIAVGDVWLAVICWKTRTVLGGLLAAISISLVVLTIASGPARGESHYPLVGAGLALVIGAALYGIGHAVQRLLDGEPGESTSGER